VVTLAQAIAAVQAQLAANSTQTGEVAVQTLNRLDSVVTGLGEVDRAIRTA
jgi:hypothetical protein